MEDDRAAVRLPLGSEMNEIPSRRQQVLNPRVDVSSLAGSKGPGVLSGLGSKLEAPDALLVDGGEPDLKPRRPLEQLALGAEQDPPAGLDIRHSLALGVLEPDPVQP